jgi:hypothetical protein
LGAIAVLTYEEQLDRDTAWALPEGSMHFEERSAVHETMHKLARRLDELGVEFVVAGAMAMCLRLQFNTHWQNAQAATDDDF